MYARDNDDINDLYQDVVLNLWKAYQSFKGHSSISTWIYRIALNTCITSLRKKKKRSAKVYGNRSIRPALKIWQTI